MSIRYPQAPLRNVFEPIHAFRAPETDQFQTSGLVRWLRNTFICETAPSEAKAGGRLSRVTK